MRLTSSLPKIAALALLSGCAPAALSTTLLNAAAPASADRVHGIPAPASARRGIYVGVSEGHFGVLGYAGANRKNHHWRCSLENGGYDSDVAVDKNGNLLGINSEYLYVYQGPTMCGSVIGSIPSVGFSEDVASNDAVNGEIVVANIYGPGSTLQGNLEICTLSGGCTVSLTNSEVARFFSVALAKNGDCWGSGYGSASQAVLVYFKGCAGSGQVATGYRNQYPGGLDIDKDGNLVSVDPDATGKASGFWIYKGCKPNCTLIGGPFAAEGASWFGHLNANSTAYAVGDYQYGQVDVYKYSRTNMTYEYSFNSGLAVKWDVSAAAYSPK